MSNEFVSNGKLKNIIERQLHDIQHDMDAIYNDDCLWMFHRGRMTQLKVLAAGLGIKLTGELKDERLHK